MEYPVFYFRKVSLSTSCFFIRHNAMHFQSALHLCLYYTPVSSKNNTVVLLNHIQ